MRRRIPSYCRTAALSLVALTAASGPGLAQSADAETLQLFTPEVASCLEDVTAAHCAELSPAMAACAEDPAAPTCAMLLADPEATQTDPEALEKVKGALTAFGEETRSALPAADAPALPEADAAPVPAENAPGAEPESTATPPEQAVTGDDPVAPEARTETTAEPEPESVPEQEPQPEPEAQAETETEAEAPKVENGTTAPAEEPAKPAETEAVPASPEPATSAETPAEGSAPVAPAAETAKPDPSAAPEGIAETAPAGAEKPVPVDTVKDKASVPDVSQEATPVDPAKTPAPPEDAQAQAAEVEQLLKEAESAAAQEPEVIDEAIAETAPASVEASAPALDAQSQALVEEMSRQPEVAAALEVLGATLAQGDEASGDEALPSAAGETPAIPATPTAPGAPSSDGAAAAETPRAALAEVVEDVISGAEIRRSTEDFASRLETKPVAVSGEGRNRDLERAGLAALGALAVGMLVNESRVVARGDDRVIVQGDDGALQVWRDDDAILRRDGGTRRMERYADGTSVSQWEREDGSQVVTVRDATGRVISRQRVLVDGTTIPLFNDAARVEPIDVSVLPEMRYRELRLGAGSDPDRALALLEQSEAAARTVDRRFSLRQIRDVRQVRELLPVLSPEPIIFQSNRASIDNSEIANLYQVGRVIERLLDRNPGEVFLIEGHTDATGSAAYNLGLSDRRAESVALALTEYFRIPPENLIVQGYGESYLRIPTEAAEDRNRRVVMRRITPLLAQ